MKKSSLLAVVGACCMLLCSCSQPTQSAKPYDFAVIDDMQVTSFKEVDGHLEKVEQKRLSKKHIMLNNMDFIDVGNYVYGTTSRDYNNYEDRANFYEFDKMKLAFSKLKSSKGADAFNGVFDGEYYYTTTQPIDGVQFYKYDKDFKLVHEKKISIQATGENMIAEKDKLYMLAEIQKADYEEGKWYVEIWILSKDFELEERIPIDYDGEYTRNVSDLAKVGDMFYISEWLVGRDVDNSIRGGTQVITYNLKTKETGAIALEESYPEFFNLDAEKQILQVSHHSHYVYPYTYTFLDLKTGKQELFRLSEQESEAEFSELGWNFTTHYGDTYYFVTDTKLIKYHYPTKKKTVYDLSEFGIKEADFLVVNQ